MLNNVKNFVISKKEAFKVGYDPYMVRNAIWGTVKGCAIGTAIAILETVVAIIYGAVKDGEFKMLVKETTKKCENLIWE